MILRIIEIFPAAICYSFAGILLAASLFVVMARVRRTLFGAPEIEENAGGIRAFMSNFE